MFSKDYHFIMHEFTLPQRLEMVQIFHKPAKRARSSRNIAALQPSAAGNDNMSILRRPQELGLFSMATWSILPLGLGSCLLKLISEFPIYPKKLTVWCNLWCDGIIGPKFFKDKQGQDVTMNEERYRNSSLKLRGHSQKLHSRKI